MCASNALFSIDNNTCTRRIMGCVRTKSITRTCSLSAHPASQRFLFFLIGVSNSVININTTMPSITLFLVRRPPHKPCCVMHCLMRSVQMRIYFRCYTLFFIPSNENENCENLWQYLWLQSKVRTGIRYESHECEKCVRYWLFTACIRISNNLQCHSIDLKFLFLFVQFGKGQQ